VWLDGEDTLLVGRWAGEQAPSDSRSLNVAAVRFPRLSNATDLDALACEPGVSVTVTTDPVVLRSADVIVLPGSRATVSDLEWLRRNRLAAEIMTAAAAGRTVIGICGGYQMLARSIDDPVESRAGLVQGLGLLPTTVRFGVQKHLGVTEGEWRGLPVSGYEIHHGVARADAGAEPFLDGCRHNSVWGTTWHGTFENDEFRRAFLAAAAHSAGVPFSEARPEGAIGFAARREAMIDRLADAVKAHLDTRALLDLVGG
jgi:adenosylcobyric acid synthase